MRIGVISDSHGKQDLMEKALAEMGQIDALLHAGDHELHINIEDYSFPVYAVRGNCDYYSSSLKSELLISLEGKKIFLTHGHLFESRAKITKLKSRALELGADIVVFGHSHVPLKEFSDGILFLNPGSFSRPKGTIGRSYAVITINDGEVDGEIFPLNI